MTDEEESFIDYVALKEDLQKQLSRGVFRKSPSENMQQIYRRTTMPKLVQLQVLHAASRRFAIVRTCDNGPGWK